MFSIRKRVIDALMISLIGFATVAAFGSHTGLAQTVDEKLLQALEYRSVGPYRGGRSTTVTGVTGDHLTYYMGATGGGVWRTRDGGASWQNVSDGQFNVGSIGAIDVADSDRNVIYVGTGAAAVRGVSASHGDGLYKSTDGGETWTHIGFENSRLISHIVIDPDDPDLVFVGVLGAAFAPSDERGVYKSTDGGATWRRVLFESNVAGVPDLKMDATNHRVLYASTWDHMRQPWEVRSGGPGSKLWKSTDAGETWEEIDEGLPELKGKMGIAPSPADPSRVWAIVEAKEKGGLYRSDDGGKSWTHVNGDRRLHARSWYYMQVQADPWDRNTVYVLNSGLYRSIDAGKTVEVIRPPHGDHHDLWINPDDPGNMINANDGGGTITFDGGASWSSIYNQPTAQIYRLTVDDQFPYWMYGGQQDNSSVGIRSRGIDGAIGFDDFSSFGGCESAFVSMRPDNPRYFYANCYLGQIDEYDNQTNTTRDVRAYPKIDFGVPPRERMYRFNWNAPVLVSQHDPNVIYHAGNVVLKTDNRGVTWTAISPDLTRNEDDKQGNMGRPITNEVSENYNTIAYLAESPHDANVLWTGSDDGLVHVTQDGGANWDNVTPRGAGEGLMNEIEVSPHDPATAYVAFTRFKYNDYTPHIYKTTDFGRRWQDLTDGIAENDFVRVVREDPVRRDMLFAGTETGVYLSFDGGRHWQSMQLKLPHVPVTDIRIKGDDLVLSTQGRGFWVVDDISPLRQMAEGVGDEALHLFAPKTAYHFNTVGVRPSGEAANPPNGAWIYYTLAEEPDLKEAKLKIEFIDADGNVVRSVTSDAEKGVDGGDGSPSAKAGLNRYVWDLQTDDAVKVPGLFAAAGGQSQQVSGYPVEPGNYTVRVSLGDNSVEQPLTVTLDPRLQLSDAQLDEKQQLVAAIRGDMDEMFTSIIAMRSIADQAEAIAKAAKGTANEQAVADAAKELKDSIEEWQDSIASRDREFFQDVLNWPDKLYSNLQVIYGTVAGQVPPVTDGMKQVYADLKGDWEAARAERDRILAENVAAFNATYDELGLGGIIMPSFESGDSD